MLKVYGMNLDGRRRGIVAATSWSKAAGAANIPVSRAKQYGCVTGNAEEIALATSRPGVCFIRETDHAEFLPTQQEA
ncbi:MAG: hypothetical protein ACOVQL_13000 [Limnohabitans sp.]|jgi:hypothetical protein